MATSTIALNKHVEDGTSMEQYFANVVSHLSRLPMEPVSIDQNHKIVESNKTIDGMVISSSPTRKQPHARTKALKHSAIKRYRQNGYRQNGSQSELIMVDLGVTFNPDEAMPHTKGRAKKA